MKRKWSNHFFVWASLIAVLCAVGCACSYEAHQEQQELQRRSHQVKDVVLACMMYASKHGDRVPNDLRDLSEVYGRGNLFLARAVNELELVYSGSRTIDNPDAVLIREKNADAKGRRMFGYLDGRAVMLDADTQPVRPQPREPGI